MHTKFTLSIFSVLLTFILSCSKEKSASKSDFGIPSEEPKMVLTPDNYSNNSLQFVNHHRKELQTVLPNSINDILLTYKHLLIEVEKNKIYATSAKEHQKYMLQAQSKAFDSLVSKDLMVNSSYSLLLQDLEDLNKQYAEKYNIPIDSFKSYYTLDKIILSEEVFLKIQDLLKEDKKRTEKLERDSRNDMIADGAVLALNLIPMGGFVAKVPSFSKSAITQIHNGISSASKNKTLSQGAGKIAEFTFNLTSKTGSSKISSAVTKKIVKMISNEAKRTSLATSVVGTGKRIVAQNVVMGARHSNDALAKQSAAPQNSAEFFKTIENKLEGRIGDFSDGIIAVHLQNVREAVKYNQKLISSKNNNRL